MTREEKQLLLIDLCGRVPHNCMVECSVSEDIKMDVILLLEHISELMQGTLMVKPYLRPMSSMTEEEEREINGLLSEVYDFTFRMEELLEFIQMQKEIPFHYVDWLNKKMFDYRGLIFMGLAIEAPKDMYN